MTKGFTLIELMAVVIIVSILAAVALPQYTKAVNRARLAEAVENAAAIQRGIDMYCTQFKCPLASGTVYFLRNGGERLDIDVRKGLSCDSSNCKSKYFSYGAGCDASECGVSVSPLTSNLGLPALSLTRTGSGFSARWTKTCSGGKAGLCESLKSQGYN